MKFKFPVIPQIDESYAYKMGIDCAKNGPNLKNCHFSIFSSIQNMKAWEKGEKDGMALDRPQNQK